MAPLPKKGATSNQIEGNTSKTKEKSTVQPITIRKVKYNQDMTYPIRNCINKNEQWIKYQWETQKQNKEMIIQNGDLANNEKRNSLKQIAKKSKKD